MTIRQTLTALAFGAALALTGCGENRFYKVKPESGQIRVGSRGVKYEIVATNDDIYFFAIKFPEKGASVRSFDFKGTNFLQEYSIQAFDGRYVLFDESFKRNARPGYESKDGNQCVREYWRTNSFPSNELRAEVINLANRVAEKRGLHVRFREGSPSIMEAQEREQRK